MNKWLVVIFAVVSYLLFGLSILCVIAFVNNAHDLMGIDRGATYSFAEAALFNASLIALFGVAHSVLARDAVKNALFKHVPASVERSSYVLQSALLLLLICVAWRAIPATVWFIEASPVRGLLWGLQALAWLLVLWSTFAIDHWELFGLKQAWLYWKGEQASTTDFRVPFLYRWVRHPMQLGLLLAFWSAPEFSQGHCLFAVLMTVYIMIGLVFEERALRRHFGDSYRRYQQTVPMLLPWKGYSRASF